MEKQEKAGDRVFKFIEEKIVKGIWKAGDKIDSENQLAEELGVSRVSVREAIGRLVAMGILSKKKGGGSFVKDITPVGFMDNLIPFLILGEGDYIEILQLRSLIDVMGVSLFIENSTQDMIENLEKVHRDMMESIDRPEDFYKYDMKFHKLIMEGSGNSLLYKVSEMIMNVMGYHAQEQYFKLPLENRVTEHQLIMDAIKKKDTEIAKIYMKRHLERSIKDLKK